MREKSDNFAMKTTCLKSRILSVLALFIGVALSPASHATGGSCEYRVEYQIKQGHEEQVLRKYAECAPSHPCENLKGHNKRLVREGDTLRIWQKAQHANECTKAAASKCFLEKNVLGKRVVVDFNGQELSSNICRDLAKTGSATTPTSTQAKSNSKTNGGTSSTNRRPASSNR
jgi:hypothetical protein